MISFVKVQSCILFQGSGFMTTAGWFRDTDGRMSDPNDPGSSDTYDENGFPFLLAIFAVLAHVCIIVVVMYYSCCRHGCTCKITIGEDNGTSDTQRENSDDAHLVRRTTASGNEDSNFGEPPPYTSDSNRTQPSILARVRDRLQSRGRERDRNQLTGEQEVDPDSISQPPPYSEYIAAGGGASGGQVNEGAEFLDLPTYQEYMRRNPELYVVDETGSVEIIKPPNYEDIATK